MWLTKVVAAFVAKCAKSVDEKEIVTAVCNAVFVHGLSVELLVKHGKNTMAITATDVVNCLNIIFQKLRKGGAL